MPRTRPPYPLEFQRQANRRAPAGAGILATAAALRWGDRLGTAEAYRFVSDHPARYPVATMCRVLSGLSQRVLRRARPLAPETGPRRHGAQGTDRADPRRGSGERNAVGRKRGARLMREGGLAGEIRHSDEGR